MSDDTMSQSQVESLLRAMQSGAEPAPPRHTAAAAPAPSRDPIGDSTGDLGSELSGAGAAPLAQQALPAPTVLAYDFKRPQPVAAEPMRAIHTLHEGIMRDCGAVLSSMLRVEAELKLASVEQVSYSEFVLGVEPSSGFHVLTVQPLEGNWILELTAPLAHAMLERLLGGDSEPGPVNRRPLTDIDHRLVGRLVAALLVQLGKAWKKIAPLQIEVERVERQSRLMPLAAAEETVILVGFAVALGKPSARGKHSGLIKLCIPYHTIADLVPQLANPGWLGHEKAEPTEATRQTISSNVDRAAVDLSVTLARSKIRTAELLDLAVGDVITTEQDVSAPLELSVQGVPKFHARPGAYRGKKAICIEGVIQP